MSFVLLSLIYLIFFLSGAAALMYEVVWVRSLSLVFGGTHLAVTSVLAVFMGGLALGSYGIGSLVDRIRKPLRLYGCLEIGVAVSAMAFIALMQIYPSIYIFLARGQDDQRLYLTLIRVLFAVVALIVPTTFMGGTLPVLTRFVSRQGASVGARLSLLYGFNTIGAVAGTAAAAFFLLPNYSVSTTIHVAIVINFVIGIVSILLEGRAAKSWTIAPPTVEGAEESVDSALGSLPSTTPEPGELLPFRLVLVGIGVSGFCALGYEVLWTRTLTLSVGTSVYGFAIMLISFLIGIGLGSSAYGLVDRLLRPRNPATKDYVIGFGLVQLIIGATALFVTIRIRDLPIHTISLYRLYASWGLDFFHVRLLADATSAFSYMAVPAFFMGVAFPLAGHVTASYESRIGHAVGRVMAYNTIGAIFGSAVSGFALIYYLGLERSLEVLILINAGLGVIVLASLSRRKKAIGAVGFLVIAAVVFLVVREDAFRVWDTKFFAIFQNNNPYAYDTAEKRRDAIENIDVLLYREGINSTISVIHPKGLYQGVLVNGKVVASSSPQDLQCQLTLGHLPMLLHKDPKKVLVVGLGTGVTLGATSVYPEVESLILAEIEPEVLGAARTFGKYNHFVLDNPKLKVIFNDGRNFLTTTRKKFDVITADPIHPWTQGSGYLYTKEYFKIAAEHLEPGGIMCQWLPLYELDTEALKSVVGTFSLHFKYTMAWVTETDAELLGSNSPIVIDEQELGRRISHNPAVYSDLRSVMMGSASDFLSYFMMATRGMRAFSANSIINTDDNLYLEFSAPRFMGINMMQTDMNAITRYRESILPYLVPSPAGKPRAEQISRWNRMAQAAVVFDRAHELFLGELYNQPEFQSLAAELENIYPDYAPGRFLMQEYRYWKMIREPSLLRSIPFTVLNDRRQRVVTYISAVVVRVSDRRAALMFVDNAARKIYGQKYFSAPNIDARMASFERDIEAALEAAYREEMGRARSRGDLFPSAVMMDQRIQDIISSNTNKRN
jgi:spermidine synthase